MSWYERTELLLGGEGVDRLSRAHVAVFGVGGVGSYAAEALARAGVGSLTLIDGDTVTESNLNRQLVALRSTIGKSKVSVMADRVRDIDPDARVTELELFYKEENADSVDFSEFDYVADAIDTVSSKLLIAQRCRDAGVPLISAMGAGNKLDPTAFEVRDIFKTEGDPLARVMRRELRARGINKLNVVFSPELPKMRPGTGGKTVGSVSFVPSSAGLVMAGRIICDIAEGKNG